MNGFATRVVGVMIVAFLGAALVSYLLLSALATNYLMNRVDERLKTEALDVASVLALLGPDASVDQIDRELGRLGHTRGADRHFFRAFDGSGQIVAHSDLAAWPFGNEDANRIQEMLRTMNAEVFAYTTRKSIAGESRALALPASENLFLEVGVDLGDTHRQLSHARLGIALAMLLTLTLGGLFGALATRKPLRGIASVGDAAERVVQDFSIRVATPTGSSETDQLAQAFNTMAAKIQALLQGQREMTDHIAHDIRSPVARMRAAAESMHAAGEAPALAGRVVEDCDQILHLVNGLLEISAAEAGAVTWSKSRVDLSLICEDAAELFEPLLEQKQHDLELSLSPKMIISGEPGVWQRIVGNLLENAIKYTEPGGSLAIHLGLKEGHVHLKVSDNGPGMTPEACSRVFERFYRVDSSRGQAGNGLGLSFCKAAVEALGGTIEVQSREGEGTRFTISQPFDQTSA